MPARSSIATFALVSWFAVACKQTPEPPAAHVDLPPAPPVAAPALELPDPPDEPSTRADAQHGAELYKRMCVVCHGEHGEGYLADQAPALAQPDFLASVSDDYLTRAISQGRRGTSMSAWIVDRGGPLSHTDVGNVIAFVRSWQRQPSVTLDERPLSGDVKRGEAAFAQHCATCHGGAQARYVRILEPAVLSTASTGFLRHALRTGRPPTVMQSYTQTLGEQGIDDVLVYIRSLPLAPALPAPAAPPPPLPLGPVLAHPRGPAPKGFEAFPARTSVEVVHRALTQKARFGLLDARAPADYADLHIAGAVSVPFYDPKPYLAQLPKDTWLVAYCACPHAESGELAQKLVNAGFTKVTILDEGLNVWAERKYPVQTGFSH